MSPAAPPPGTVPDEDLGLAHGAGGSHYRAYVGPPEHYDVIAAMTFNLLTTIGLRQEHTLLDVGCGSLRSGRLFIPYLNRGGYFGLEPNGWLVEAGVRREVGRDLVAMKRPTFVIADHADALPADARFDFAVAQSIFSHTGTDLLIAWLDGIARRLKPGGALAATYLPGASDPVESGLDLPRLCGTATRHAGGRRHRRRPGVRADPLGPSAPVLGALRDAGVRPAGRGFGIPRVEPRCGPRASGRTAADAASSCVARGFRRYAPLRGSNAKESVP